MHSPMPPLEFIDPGYSESGVEALSRPISDVVDLHNTFTLLGIDALSKRSIAHLCIIITIVNSLSLSCSWVPEFGSGLFPAAGTSQQ